MKMVHNVYFKLKDAGPEAIQAMIDDCYEYLSSLPGIEFLAAATCSDMDRSVNDRDYDVALHVIFQDRPSLEAYGSAPRHVAFIEKHSGNWQRVRVFDSCVVGEK